MRAGRPLDQVHQIDVGGGAVDGARALGQVGHLGSPPPRAQREGLPVDEESDHVGIALRRPEREASVRRGDEVVARLLQLIAHVGDQLGLVQLVGTKDHADLAVGASLLGKRDGDAGQLAERIEAGATGELLDLVLIGLVLLRLLGQLGRGWAGPQPGDVDRGHHLGGDRKQRQPTLDGGGAIVGAPATAAASSHRHQRDQGWKENSPLRHIASDAIRLGSHAFQGGTGLGARGRIGAAGAGRRRPRRDEVSRNRHQELPSIAWKPDPRPGRRLPARRRPRANRGPAAPPPRRW